MLTHKKAMLSNFGLSLKVGPIAVLAAASFFLLASAIYGDEIHVLSSGSFTEASHELVPAFERATSNQVVMTFGGSMGHSPTSVPGRVERGEPVDVVIVASSTLDELTVEGKIAADSRVKVASSRIGMVVRAGAPKPDISSVEALKRTLLKAKSIAISDGASGVYLSTEMFRRLGISDQVMAKRARTDGGPVATVVARGDAEIGFEQISELLPVPGITFGPLPAEVQKVTTFSAGIVEGAKHSDAGRKFIKFLASPAGGSILKKTGLEPIASQ